MTERREHTVTINARGCDTTRECYCLATNGFDHHEYQSRWVVDKEGHYERSKNIEPPPDPPFHVGEDLEEYRLRVRSAEVWDEAAEAVADWMSNNPTPAGIPIDSPRNPYRD